ncbi:MAG: adenylyl-sulfate kinase [Patescibacteria group bacterium]|nr:adenylyl-sulfate kinase [Patescibacteria group bacterium]
MKNINNNENIELVNLVAAGSVDDGKSTLIGRLMYDSKVISADQLRTVKITSKKRGFEGIDFSLFTDGLSAEREQGITIDVAYRYFGTKKRRFVIADVPGHEQYTRNMVTGASKANLALLIADARKGLLIQSKRHLFIASLLGIPHIAIIVNKMDLMNYQEKTYDKIKDDFTNFAAKMNISDLQFIPVSSLKGDMVVNRRDNMPWYNGPTVLSYLENLEISSDRNMIDFRFPIQYVIRPHQNFRGLAGKIEGGTIKPGQKVKVLPSGKETKIDKLICHQKSQKLCYNPQSIVIKLKDEVDASRGDMIVKSKNIPEISKSFNAMVCWFSDTPLDQDKTYLLKHLAKTTRCSLKKLQYIINIDNLHRKKANKLKINEIGKINITTNEPILFDPYPKNRNTGCFIIIDQLTNNTIAAGVIIDRAKEKKKASKSLKKGAVLWFTGLSGSGKSTVANKVYEILSKKGIDCQRLDGDIMRQSLSKDLGFSKKDRETNIERAGFVAEILAKHEVMVLTAFISPYKKQRAELRKKIDNFVEIFVEAPLSLCEKRDVKGLYKKAKKGEIKHFTGISHPYEKPQNPQVTLHTKKESLNTSANKVITYLRKNNYI